MFLATRDGIICDYCGTIYKEKFVYYSTRSILCKIVNNQRFPPTDAELSSDMCTACYDNLLKRVESFIGDAKQGRIKCDLSNTYGSGTFHYHIIYFDQIDVDKDRDEKVVSQKNVMDLNVINGYEELVAKTQVTKEKISSEGQWT